MLNFVARCNKMGGKRQEINKLKQRMEFVLVYRRSSVTEWIRAWDQQSTVGRKDV